MELATTLAAISAAKDFAALIIGRRIDAAVTEKAIDLQNSIIALQSGILEMQAQIQSLTTQKLALQDAVEAAQKWDAEVQKHELVAIAKGVHVVAVSGKPGHGAWFCSNCWQRQFKSILQRIGQDYGGTHYYCPSCDAKIYDHSDRASII